MSHQNVNDASATVADDPAPMEEVSPAPPAAEAPAEAPAASSPVQDPPPSLYAQKEAKQESHRKRKGFFLALLAGAALYSVFYHQKLCVIGCGVGGLFLFALYKFQNKLLYFPDIPPGSRTIFIDPIRYKKKDAFEEVFFKTEDNVKIQAWLFKQPTIEEAPTFLYFHGNAGNLSHRLENIRDFYRRLRVNIFIVSYRGYGKSEGSSSEEGIMRDARAAMAYLTDRGDIATEKIVVFGRSLGGAVAVHLAAENSNKPSPAAIVIENTFTSILDMIDEVFPLLSFVKSLSTNIWDNRTKIQRVTCPVLMLSGAKDELVPSYMMQELFDNIKHKNRKMVTFTNGHHMDVWTIRGYSTHISDFLKQHKIY